MIDVAKLIDDCDNMGPGCIPTSLLKPECATALRLLLAERDAAFTAFMRLQRLAELGIDRNTDAMRATLATDSVAFERYDAARKATDAAIDLSGVKP